MIPMAYGFDPNFNGLPNAEGKERIRRAVCKGNQKKDAYGNDGVYMTIAGGMPEVAGHYGALTLAQSARIFIERCRYWKPQKIRINPHGYNTPTELIAAKQVIRAMNGTPHAVSSWWHSPRVYITGLVIFGPRFKVSMSRTTLRGKELRIECLHECGKILVAIPHAMWTRLTFRPEPAVNFALI
jgi:hypothetical protein